MFDFGTFIGGITIGIIGDKIKKRAILIVPSLVREESIYILDDCIGSNVFGLLRAWRRSSSILSGHIRDWNLLRWTLQQYIRDYCD